MKKTGWASIFSLCVALFCCACGAVSTSGGQVSSSTGSGAAPSFVEMPYIGIILKSLDNPYFSLIKTGAEEEAAALGVQAMVVAPDHETDTDVQASMLETMATMAMDVLIIAPSAEETLADGLALAAENEKLLMAVDTDLAFDGCSCFIGTDNYAAAYAEGSYAAQLTGQGAYAVILRGQEGDTAHDARTQGIADALHAGGVYVLDCEICDSSEAQAAQTMAQLLRTYGNLDIVCTTSGSMAVGAQRAIAAAARPVHLVCFDGTAETAALVANGQADMAIAQDAYEIGRQCIQRAVQLFHNQSVARHIYIDTAQITKENAEAYLSAIEQRETRRNTK